MRDVGSLKIDHQVIGRIASIAAREVPGVAGVHEGFGWGKGWRWPGRVRVEAQDREVRISVPITVEYGVNLPRVALQVQEQVREAVHRMTDLSLIDVDVRVRGVREPRKEERP